LGVTRQAVYRTTRELEALDVLALEPDLQRRNQKIIRMTPRGRQVVAVARRCLEEVEERIRERIGARDFDRLARILNRDWGPVVGSD
jgi:DNA-binding MarR family transcriptional regulator